MKITRQAYPGKQLQFCEFGDVVRIHGNDAAYMVISLSNGTGTKNLLSLQSGSVKHAEATLIVIPVDAELLVGGDL